MHTTLRQIYKKLNEIDLKVSALMIKEEKATKSELKAIRLGQNEFSQGKFRDLREISNKGR